MQRASQNFRKISHAMDKYLIRLKYKVTSVRSVVVLFSADLRYVSIPMWEEYLGLCRSSRLEVFCKKGVLKYFAKSTRKHLCQSLFFHPITTNIPDHKETSQFICSANELIGFYLIGNTARSWANKVANLRPATLLKMDSGTAVFCEFCKIFKNTFFSQNTSSGCLLPWFMMELFCKNSQRPVQKIDFPIKDFFR